jgi:GT2 family glycosyltransferase
MQLAGYKIMACPASVVYHVGGGTLPKSNQKKTYLNFRNNLVMLAKNLPLQAAWWKLPVRICLDALSAWKTLLGGQPGYFWAVVKAHAGFIQWLFFQQKSSVFPAKKNGAINGWLNKSVVKAYFLNQQTKFSEIVPNNS